MKKFYILLSGAALCAYALVSMPSQVSAQGKLAGGLASPGRANSLAHPYVLNQTVNTSSRTVTSNWLNYWFVADSLAHELGNATKGFYVYLFSDTTVQICSPPTSDTCGSPFIHLMGTVLDPSSTDMQRIYGYSWSNANPYWVDSIGVFYDYVRNTADNIVDTLEIFLWNNAVSGDLPIYFYGDAMTKAAYGDTVRVAEMLYDSTGANVPRASAGAIKTFKIPLTATDTGSYGINTQFKTIYTNHFFVPQGKLVASAYKFIPGYTHLPEEKISSTENVFAFISDQPNGDALGIGQGSYAPYTKGDYNSSQIVDPPIRYNVDTIGYNGFFIPTFGFTAKWQLQEHLVSYYITGTFDVGINESVSTGGTKLYQNQPNPANHTALVRYETKSSGPVTFEVRDITGRVVMEMNQGTQSAGDHSLTIDVSKLSNGIYLYSLKTKNESLTRRMVISE